MTVLLPLMGVEVLANLANLHSVLMWGCFWALLRQPRTLRGALALACFTLLAALSEVQTVFLMPLALGAFWVHRSYRHFLVVAGCGLGVALQMLTALTHERPMQPHVLDPTTIVQLLGLQVAMPLWVPETGPVHALFDEHTRWLPALAALPLILGFVLALRFGDRLQRLAALAAAAVGLLIFSVSHMLSTAVMGGPGYSVLDDAPVLQRYGVVPSLLFIALLAIGTSAAWRRHQSALGSFSGVLMLALLTAALAHFRNPENVRDPGTSWTRQMAEAHATCQNPANAEHQFRISPNPWLVGIPCSLIR
jgi:hypothetical protein